MSLEVTAEKSHGLLSRGAGDSAFKLPHVVVGRRPQLFAIWASLHTARVSSPHGSWLPLPRVFGERESKSERVMSEMEVVAFT